MRYHGLMTTNETQTQSVSDYAQQHGIPAGDMIEIISADPEPEPVLGYTGNLIETDSGVYGDPVYPVPYLDLIADGVCDDLR